jgi:ankyrin repeat protein
MNLLKEVSNNNYDEVVNLLKEAAVNTNEVNLEGETPLLIAVRLGLFKIVEILLLNIDTDLNIICNKNKSIFSWAIQRNAINTIKLLIDDDRLDINIKTSKGCYLNQAIESNNLYVVEELLDMGGLNTDVVNITDAKGNNPLHLAAGHNKTRLILRALLDDSRFNLTQENDKLQTPMDIAKESGRSNLNIIELQSFLKDKFGL